MNDRYTEIDQSVRRVSHLMETFDSLLDIGIVYRDSFYSKLTVYIRRYWKW